MVSKLMVEQGFYIVVDINVEEKLNTFNLELGPAYQEDDLKTVSITDDGKFLRYYENGNQVSIRDTNLSNTFDGTVVNYIKLLIERFPRKSILKRVNGEFVNYFDEE